ncbi:MAG: flagellar hook capping FlgD N-terminal domain-containing protein [Solirubrobacteraceae bacterium]
MSVSTPAAGTNSSGQAEQGTSGSKISNSSSLSLNTNEFLNLMMDELQNQDPLNPSSSDPTQYLTELAQMTSVEQETNTAQNTQTTAQGQSVSQAVGLIGDSVTYLDQSTGDKVTGTVSSVQITSSGPTLTVDGTAGVDLGSILNVTAAGSPTTGSPATGSPATGSPTAGSPTAGSPTTGSSTAGSSTTGSPTTGSPTTGSPATGSPTWGSGTSTGTGA